MPFNAPFKTTFTAGDLLYGLATTRSKLALRLGTDILTVGGPATVDQYRKSTMEVLSKTDRRAWKTFLVDNERHPRYGRYRQAIRSHGNDEEAFASRVNAISQNAAWRAKSKFGMEWTIQHQRGHVHFILDDLDMAAVITKTHTFTDQHGTVLAQDSPRGKAPAGTDKERTITHSELRWIYRNRLNLGVQARVQFWRTVGGIVQPCGPPWENTTLTTTMPSGRVLTWSHAWRAYRPTTERTTF
jgi:hypothetical protein